jgi:hypothetical protein
MLPATSSIAVCIVFTAAIVSADEPLFLGHRTLDNLPILADDELGTPQQQSLLQALGGDPYGHMAADHARAGCAMLVRSRAIPSNTRHYGGYWLGGGVPVIGAVPVAEDGTYGWDYFGILFSKRIDLRYSHGHRYQGGTGAYKTDGPRLRHEK